MKEKLCRWFILLWNLVASRGPNRAIIQRSDFIEICYHEAGHAVMAYYLGFEITHVTVLFDLYHARPGTGLIIPVAQPQKYDSDMAARKRRIIQSMAGRIAELKFSGKRFSLGARTDMQIEYQLAHSFESWDHLLLSLERETLRILETESVWNAVSDLAEMLRSRHKLKGSEVKDLVVRYGLLNEGSKV